MSTTGKGRLREDIIATCQAMNASGLNEGTSGNVSARCGDGFLITPSGIAYNDMAPAQVVRMDLDGGHEGAWAPSSEWRMHLAIYRDRTEAGAVVHTHSPHAAALSCLREDIPAFHYMVARFGGVSLRCADYATFGTEALSAAMMAALEDRTACLLANHGQICFGSSLDHALGLAGEVEALCQQYFIARLAGDPVILGEDEMRKVLARFSTYGKQPGGQPSSR